MVPIYGVHGLIFKESRWRSYSLFWFRSCLPAERRIMGEPNNVLNVYMNRQDRLRSVLEYYLGEKLPENWRFDEEDGNRKPVFCQSDLSLAFHGA